MSKEPGPGVKQFWDLVKQDSEPDLADLARRFPNERLALAEAVQAHASQVAATRRERMWSVRNRILVSQGQPVSLGSLIQEKRVAAGLRVEDVAKRLSQEGAPVGSDAVRRLEEGRLGPMAIKSPSLWRVLSNVLSIEGAQLIAFLETTLRGPRPMQQFTRMARGAGEEDRESFIDAATATSGDQVEHYLDGVRRELGLPTRAGHLAQ